MEGLVFMKTTVEISDSLLREAREVAARKGVTLRTLVERGLHRIVAEMKDGAPFKLRRASFNGKGRQAELREASWDTLRDLIYKDRGA
jgi:antitoxin component of RelBE/YafQ-DinJ toxin-antitoxin module